MSMKRHLEDADLSVKRLKYEQNYTGSNVEGHLLGSKRQNIGLHGYRTQVLSHDCPCLRKKMKISSYNVELDPGITAINKNKGDAGDRATVVRRKEPVAHSVRELKPRIVQQDCQEVSQPTATLLFHSWKLPAIANMKNGPTNDSGSSAFNCFNYWKESLPVVDDVKDVTEETFGDFSWWRVTPNEAIDVDLLDVD